MTDAVASDPERLGDTYARYHQSLEVGDPGASGVLFQAVESASRESDAVLAALGRHLEARHPSQLYEAILEGAVLFLILFALRVLRPQLRPGILTGLFFSLYAVFRIIVEQFREPDSAWVVEGLLTKGQFYSVFLFLIGVAFLVYAFFFQGKKAPDPAEA